LFLFYRFPDALKSNDDKNALGLGTIYAIP
jgi:hypothetical protein